MSDSEFSNTGTFHAASVTGTAGATLRAAREKAGLRLDEVAVRTKIPLHVLEAIEHDDTAKLGQPVYVRGYLRKYAKAMSLQETQVLTAFDANVMKPPPEATRLAEEQVVDKSGGDGKPLIWLLIVIIVAAAVGAGVLWIRGWGPAAIHRKPTPARVAPAQRVAPPPANPAPAPEPIAPPPVEQAPQSPAPATDAQPQGQQ
ncbi:MAG TPA: helix-turn-helix domain-containing protein [Nevskiaceae bacterium]|nr:helix-turn-helix domain-containing protein [Nevskiaceae bacterium]